MESLWVSAYPNTQRNCLNSDGSLAYCGWERPNGSARVTHQNELARHPDWGFYSVVTWSWEQVKNGENYEAKRSIFYFDQTRASRARWTFGPPNSGCPGCGTFFTMDHRYTGGGGKLNHPYGDYYTSLPPQNVLYDVDGWPYNGEAELAYMGDISQMAWRQIDFTTYWEEGYWEQYTECNRTGANWYLDYTMSAIYNPFHPLPNPGDWVNTVITGPMSFPTTYQIGPCSTPRNSGVDTVVEPITNKSTTYMMDLGLDKLSSKVVVLEETNQVFIKINGLVQSKNDLEEYIAWSENELFPIMQQLDNAEKLLTVVTFNSPIEYAVFDELVESEHNQLVSVQVAFKNLSDDIEEEEKWTFSVSDIQQNDYINRLEQMIQDAEMSPPVDTGLLFASEDNPRSVTLPSLQPVGIYATTVWLTAEKIEMLKKDERVLLADVTPSYARMLATQNQQLGNLRHADSVELDGYSSSISVSLHNLYYATSFLQSDVTNPTSVEFSKKVNATKTDWKVIIGFFTLLLTIVAMRKSLIKQ